MGSSQEESPIGRVEGVGVDCSDTRRAVVFRKVGFAALGLESWNPWIRGNSKEGREREKEAKSLASTRYQLHGNAPIEVERSWIWKTSPLKVSVVVAWQRDPTNAHFNQALERA